MDYIDIVTGCDTGIGYELVKLYIKEDKRVIYSYIGEDPFIDNKKAFGLKLDLKYEDQINSFYLRAKKIIDENNLQLKNLINNSGIGLGGPVENTPLSYYREVMEVNFFGLLSLTQKFIPELINNQGRLIIHGSMGGRISLPFLSAYTTSKFALEGLNDSLRRELKPFNVQVCLLETGGVATPIWSRVKDMDFSFIDKKYRKYSDVFLRDFVGSANRSLKTETASLRFFKLIKRKKLPYRYRVAEHRLKNFIPLILPTGVMDFILKKMLNM